MSRVFQSLDDPEFNRLFSEFQKTAFRLETLQTYGVAYEQQEFSEFLKGKNSKGVFPGIADWITKTILPAVDAGKKIFRVHVIREPLSDYVRFECSWSYRHTVSAGEDVRIVVVPSGDDWPGEIPKYDFWLFDSTQLVEMHYRKDGAFTHAEIVDDNVRIAHASKLRDMTMAMSIGFTEFAKQHDDDFRKFLA